MSTSAPTHVVEVNGDRDRALRRSTPQDVGLAPASPDAVAGGDAGGQRRDHARDPRGRAGPAPRPRGAQRRRRDLRRRAAPTSLAEGVELRARGGRLRRRRPTRSTTTCALSAELAAAADERPRPHRRRDARRGPPPPPARCRSPSSRRRLAGAATTARSPRRSIAPRRLGHRRAQAPLAVGRRDPRRARRSPRSSQAYERGGAAALSILTEGPHFGGSLDDLREARAALEPADPAQGLHRRPLPGLRVRGLGADALLLIVAALEPRDARRPATPRRRALDLDVLVEVHDEEELELRARGRRRRRHRHQQPRPRRLHASTSSAPTSCSPTSRPARRSSRSPASTPASSSTSSSASASTPCSSARR